MKKRKPEVNFKIKSEITKRSRRLTDAAGREVMVLGEIEAAGLADRLGLSIGQIFEAALEGDICPARYLRNREIISTPEQLKLARSCAGIVGAGGLGGQIILVLARMGIGRLIVIDHDCFDETNLNRQALSVIDNLGKLKAEQASQTIGAINPGVTVDSRPIRIDSTNVENILSEADVVLDALDNISDRFLVESTVKTLGIPLVHGAVAGLEGQIMTIFPEDEGLKLIYGTSREERRAGESPEIVFGVPAVTPALVGTFQAMEAIKIILNKGIVFRHRMVHLDLESGRLHEIKFKD